MIDDLGLNNYQSNPVSQTGHSSLTNLNVNGIDNKSKKSIISNSTQKKEYHHRPIFSSSHFVI